jgi:hypothetical protein
VNVPRKQITAGVFGVFTSAVLPTSISGTGTWKSSSKDVEMWTEIPAYDQPYCGLVCPEDTGSDPQAFGITKWIRTYYGLIYFRRDAIPPAEGTSFQDTIDDLLDSLDMAFVGPRKGEANTLGNIVQNCTIDGTIYVDPGTLDQQCVIVVPVKVITGI